MIIRNVKTGALLAFLAAQPAVAQVNYLTAGPSNSTSGLMQNYSPGLGNTVDNLGGSGYYRNYMSVYYVPTATATFTFGQTQSAVDTAMILYSGRFDPANSRTNALILDDDARGPDHYNALGITPPPRTNCNGENFCPQFTLDLEAGKRYSVVIANNSGRENIEDLRSLGSTEIFYAVGPGFFLIPPSFLNTIQAMARNAASLQGVVDSRISNLAFMSNYDCQTFDKHGVCLSFQARYTKFDNFNEGAGVVTAAYRLTNSFRMGAFIDYRVSENAPTGIKLSNDLPTFGAFLGYSQNHDGTGLQGKALAAYQKGNATVTRMGSEDLNTEAGSGKTSLNAYVLSGELGWGFALSPTLLVTPYLGIRYTDATRGSYAEAASNAVQFPISYNDYYQRFTTAFTGVRFSGMLSDKVGYQIGAGFEYDLQQKTSGYSGTSEIPGLEAFTIPTNGVDNRARAFGSVGMFYQVEKNQRLVGNVGIRNQVFTNQTALNFMAGYQVAF
jgi:hypothetical protein